MRLKGRESQAWHRDIDLTAGDKKPTDLDFPWVALQNRTGYYLKKKGKLIQYQIDERLLALIETHPSKEVAIAAVAHSVSVGAIRNLLADDWTRYKNGRTFVLDEYLQSVVAIHHVQPEAVNRIEAGWAICLLDHGTTGGLLRHSSLGQQLHDLLPLLTSSLAPNLALRARFMEHAHDVCLNFGAQLEHLRQENQWADAYQAVKWLSLISSSTMLNPGARLLLDEDLPAWRVWAAWRPQLTRLRAWKTYIISAPEALKDLFALEGPDFATVTGREKTTLRDGLIEQDSSGSQSELQWGRFSIKYFRNPFITSDNLSGILERLTGVMDFACSAGTEYRALIVHLCVGKVINTQALQILESVRIFGKPAFTTAILQALTVPRALTGQGTLIITQLLSMLSDARMLCLREQLKPLLVGHISYYFEELQNAVLVQIDAGTGWNQAAIELADFTHGLRLEHWLLGDLDSTFRQSIVQGPSKSTIATLCTIHDAVQSSKSSTLTPLLCDIDAYCKSRCVPSCEAIPEGIELIELLVFIWQQPKTDRECQELALFITGLPRTSFQFRRDCLNDLPNLGPFRVRSTLETLRFSKGSLKPGYCALVKLLALDIGRGSHVGWRHVLLWAIEERHGEILRLGLSDMTVKEWVEMLGNIRTIYEGSNTIRSGHSIKVLNLELHSWSQQLAVHIPLCLHLQRKLKGSAVLDVLKLGSTPEENLHLLRILHLVKQEISSFHQLIYMAIMNFLPEQDAQSIEEVLSALSKAGPLGVEACVKVLDARQQTSPRFAEVTLAIKLRAINQELDRNALKKVATFLGIRLDRTGDISGGDLQEVASSFHEQYVILVTEAQRLENLRLSLQAIAPRGVLEVLTKLNIKAPSVVDDALAVLPPSLRPLIEGISQSEIELQFPLTDLSSSQLFAIGAGPTETLLVRLGLSRNGTPLTFCVHLSGEHSSRIHTEPSSSASCHTGWELFRGEKAPQKQYCRGRPNRGTYQLSRMLWVHLRHDFRTIEQTHAFMMSKISKFGQGCLVCGIGQRRLRRGTTCQSPNCQAAFGQAHIGIQLAEIWQDPSVMDLLLATIYATASTGKLDLLTKFPASSFLAVNHLFDKVPPIQTLAKHLTSCLHVAEDTFRLETAISGFCSSSSERFLLASSLLWACTSYRSFIMSATGAQRIPSFGTNQFLLANAPPELEIAFSKHVPNPQSTSHILFHGTSLDRLHAIICQGLRVQSGTAFQRHGAAHGAGVYMADEPSVAWGYSTVSTGGWNSSNLKNMKVLLGCELAGDKPQAPFSGIYVITDATRLAVRYIFLLPANSRMPAAKDVRLPMNSVFQRIRSGTL